MEDKKEKIMAEAIETIKENKQFLLDHIREADEQMERTEFIIKSNRQKTMTEKLRYIEMDNGYRLYEHKDAKEIEIKNELIKIAGSRIRGFTKKQLEEIFNRFNLDLDWKIIYSNMRKYQPYLFFKKSAWYYNKPDNYRNYLEGFESEFIRNNKELIKEVFPLEDFKERTKTTL